MSDHNTKPIPNAISIPWSVKQEGWGVRVNVERWTFKFTPIRVAMIGFAALAALAMGYRLIMGLESVTNLNDDWPWGLWKAIAVFSGIALAGGGFSMAFLVHVLKIQGLKPVARMTLCASMIAYFLGLLGLFLEIGRWFNVYVPFYSWGHESPMFETFFCIASYTVIQSLEFCEIVTEKIFRKIHWFFVKIFPALVVIGVMLPTMHQSTLGTLYLLAEGKLSPLWWSPIIFVLFLISSVYVGPASVAVISVLNDKSLGHRLPVAPMRLAAQIGASLMIIYLVLRIGDLVARNQLGAALSGTTESCLLLTEIILGLIIPLVIVFSPLGKTRGGLITYGVLTCFGVLLNRSNTVLIGMWENAGGVQYFPSALECLIISGLVVIALLGYIFLCENFSLLGEKEETETKSA